MRAQALGVVLGVTLLVAPSLEALDPSRAITQYVRESWIVKDGAPAGTISAITQTTDGYLWLGTEGDGLVRFDGVSFVHVEALDAVFGRRVDQVTSMISARDGSLWVGTTFGLARQKDGAWSTFDRGDAKHVFGLHEAPDGTIWYARHWDGIFHLAGGTLTNIPLTAKPRFVTTDLQGTVWAGGYEGLWRVRGDDRRLYSTRDGLADRNVNQVYRDPQGAVWVGLRVGLTLVRDDKIAARFTTRDGLSSDDVSAIYQDRDGLLWVGTANGGLNRRRGERFECLNKALGLTSDRVTAIHEDHEGSLWVGTASGLNRLRDANLLPIGETEGLNRREPLAVAEGKDGSMFVTSGFGGPQLDQGGPYSGDVSPGRVRLRRGPLRGPGRGALDRPWRRTVLPKGRQERDLPGGGTGQRGDPRCPEPRVCHASGEVFRLVDGRGARFRLADGTLLGPETFGFDYVWQLQVTKDGTLWLATTRGVFAVRDGKARRVWSLGRLSARSVSEDEEGTVWLGTMAGVVRVKGESLVTFSTREGLAEDDVHNVLSDGQGGLWMSGSRGLSRVKRESLEEVARGSAKSFVVERFGVAEGMRTSVATVQFQPAATRTRDGRLWFATTGGIVVADPAHLKRNPLPPPVVVEALVADGRAVALRASGTGVGGDRAAGDSLQRSEPARSPAGPVPVSARRLRPRLGRRGRAPGRVLHEAPAG